MNTTTCYFLALLEFWPIDKFQGKTLTNRRVSKNRHNALYPVSLANKF